jgi:hypothetical protein
MPIRRRRRRHEARRDQRCKEGEVGAARAERKEKKEQYASMESAVACLRKQGVDAKDFTNHFFYRF